MTAPLRKLLINDEGTSSLHYFDLDDPSRDWKYRGAGRDLQLIGKGRVLRSSPQGFAELDLVGGAVIREVVVRGVPGGIESARRLATGNTIIAGNGGGGVFVWELDVAGDVVPGRRCFFSGIDKVRLLRLTTDGTFLFCSETAGVRIIHEADWTSGATTLFQVPDEVPADSMVKAVRVAPHIVTVSTGYAASLLRIDTETKRILKTIGGKSQADPVGTGRSLLPFFFSGYQMFENGDILVSNWQGHSPDNNGRGYQLLKYNAAGELRWFFDQTAFPALSSLNNVIVLDGIDTQRLHDEPDGIIVPIA